MRLFSPGDNRSMKYLHEFDQRNVLIILEICYILITETLIENGTGNLFPWYGYCFNSKLDKYAL